MTPARGRAANVGGLAIAAVTMLVLAIWLLIPVMGALHLFGITEPAELKCGQAETPAPPFALSLIFIAAGVASFVAGNGLGIYRSGAAVTSAESSCLVRGTLTLLFLVVACALAYETVATWLNNLDGTDFKPITTFVRCAAHHYPIHTVVVDAAASFLIGQWFHTREPA